MRGNRKVDTLELVGWDSCDAFRRLEVVLGFVEEMPCPSVSDFHDDLSSVIPLKKAPYRH